MELLPLAHAAWSEVDDVVGARAIEEALDRARRNREEVEREGVRPQARASPAPAVSECVRPAVRVERVESLEERIDRVRNEWRRGRWRRLRQGRLLP